MRYLIDTNVLSEAQRAGGDPRVRAALASLRDEELFLSVITIGEIVRGIALLPAGKRRDDLANWLRQTESLFADRVLPISQQVARVWGEMTVSVSRSGRTLAIADGLIAATAMHHGMQLLTRNVNDFRGTGVMVVNPIDL